MDKKQLIEHMRKVQAGRTTTAFAQDINCSVAYLSDIYNNKREPGHKVLSALGFEKQVTYKKWRVEDAEHKEE